jgi:hypothetical protein
VIAIRSAAVDWTQIVLVGAGILILPYVLGPAAIKATLRFFGQPKIDVLGDRPVPPRATELWESVDAQMAALGFQAGPPMRVQGTPSIWALCKVYAKPADKDLGMAAAMYRTAKGQVIPSGQNVEFSSEFGTEGSVATTNSKEVGFEAPSQERTILRAPRVQEVKELYAMHKEACRKFGYGAKQPIPAGEWWVTSVKDSLEKYGRRMCDAGYMYTDRRGDYLLTWKGALMGTYQNLFPWKYLRRRRMNAAVEELRKAGRV